MESLAAHEENRGSDATDATQAHAQGTHSKKCLLMSCDAIHLGPQCIRALSLPRRARHESNLKRKTKIKVYFFRPFRA